ncbi:High-affinity branched-chain amino acid transport system permease protein LivH [Burkholderiales bacterium]|nr:High-affinity branched-chain amino acid transport system permease protein LivH [Burkholderiales bacterium]
MTAGAFAVQLLNGLASASSLFLVAAGLTLIFGVTRVVNFAHGSLYMLGAYVAWSVAEALSATPGASGLGFAAAVLGAVLAAAVVGSLVEVLILKRLYAAPELLQLTATFAIVLIVRDVALAIWGAEDLLGRRVPGLDGSIPLGTRSLPEYDAFLIVAGPLVLVALTLLVRRTRFGVQVRAAAENRTIVAALGVDQAKLYTAVFALGAALAGLAGALQLPREPANLAMDLSIIADAFVVTVVGGLGSIPGAFVAALVIGLTKALCIALGSVDVAGVEIAFPKLTLVAEFVVMAIVLAVRPHGFFGTPASLPPSTPLAEQRTLVVAPGRRELAIGAGLVAAFVALPLLSDEYSRVLATDILIATLFAASLRFLMGPAGLTSFGHAAYFGVGAYAAALAAKQGLPMLASMAVAPVAALAAAIVFGWFCVRLSGVYLAMLTLAFAQITWSVVFQWDAVTGGSNGIVGVWPTGTLADATHFSWFTLGVVSIALLALARIAMSPFGQALRGARDSPLRAEAIGIDVRARQWAAFALAGAFAGLAGGLFAFSKGSISPETLAIPRSVDALVMVLLGGLNATFGPVLGAAVFTWGQDLLARATDYWRAALGVAILVIVLVVPNGIGGMWAALRARRGSA